MRPSIAPGRPSMGGQRSTAGLSNRFTNQPVDFKRYSIAGQGTGQRQSMAPARFQVRQTIEARTENAKELAQFFQTHGAVFAYDLKMLREGPTRNDFRTWFEFIIKMISRSYELSDSNQSMNEEVPALLICLNCPITIKNSTMLALNTPHQWPTLLNMMDWLRKLVLIYQEDEPSGNEKQDYTFKYAFDAFRQKLNGNEDYTEILAAIREVIVCSSSYDDLNEEIKQAQQIINENDAKIESEGAAILQVEKEISDFKSEIDKLARSEDDLKFLLNSMNSKTHEIDNDVKALEEKLQNMRAENDSLNHQVNSQSMTAYEAHELLQKRTYLNAEYKEKRIRHEKLQNQQTETNKILTKLATEKTDSYRAFCSELGQQARAFDVEKEHRNFECALFGKSGGADALRAVQLGGQVSDAFRVLISAIRNNLQRRLNEINQLRLDSQFKKLQNENRMTEQTLQQLEQRNKLDLNKREMKLREAENELKLVEQEYEAAGKKVDEIVKQNVAITERADHQARLIRQVEARLENIDLEETYLLNQFADYLVEATARFDSISKTNEELVQQKEMMLEISAKIVENIKLLLGSLPAAKAQSLAAVPASLDDLLL